MATNMGRVRPPDPNANADHGMGAPSGSLAAAKQRASNALQRLRYVGGQDRADAQKSSYNHR